MGQGCSGVVKCYCVRWLLNGLVSWLVTYVRQLVKPGLGLKANSDPGMKAHGRAAPR